MRRGQSAIPTWVYQQGAHPKHHVVGTRNHCFWNAETALIGSRCCAFGVWPSLAAEKPGSRSPLRQRPEVSTLAASSSSARIPGVKDVNQTNSRPKLLTLRRCLRTECPFADTPSVKPDSVGTEVLESETQIREAEPASRAVSH